MESSNMNAVRGEVAAMIGDRAVAQLSQLESMHREIQHNHERVLRNLDVASSSADRRDLQIAWNQYREVVADLSKITEEIGSLRLSMG
jgi:plasmid maintenance system killer protein